MKHWKDIASGLFTSLTLAACYGGEDSFTTPDIYKDYQPILKDGNTVAGYAATPLKEAKYDKVLSKLYFTWGNSNSGWERRDGYVRVEVKFNSPLPGKKIGRVMIPNVGDPGNLTVKRWDYGNGSTTLCPSKYRTAVVIDRYGVEELRFRSIYRDADNAQQISGWTNLSGQADKYELQVDINYAAWQYFKTSQAAQVQISFESDLGIRPVSVLYDLIGDEDGAVTQEELRKWYYMDCAAMSFDSYNLAFDPYSKLCVFTRKDQTGGAYAIDYPIHNEGRGVVCPASESNPNDAWWKLPDMQHVSMHEMGHCVQWMPKQGKYIMEGMQDRNRRECQEGWPDTVRVASKGHIPATQKEEYQAATAKSYRNPQSGKYFVRQADYSTSGVFMSWLRLYNGDLVRMLPWTVLTDELTDQRSLKGTMECILKEDYPDLMVEELWSEYKAEAEVSLQNN